MNYARLLFLPPLLHSIYTVSFQTSFITELALWSTLVSFFFLSLSYFSLLYTHGVRIKEKDRKKKKREREKNACCIRWTWEHRKTIEWKFFFFIDSLTKFLQRKMLPEINSLVLFLLVTYIIVFVEFSSSNSSPGGNAPMEIIPVFFFSSFST